MVRVSVKPLSHINDCEHDWTRLLQSCSVVFNRMKGMFTIVFGRVQGYEHRVAKIIVLNSWACSKNQQNFYRVLWPINGRVRPYEGCVRSYSTVWRACSVVFEFGHTTEHVLHTVVHDRTRPSYASHTVQHVSHTVQHASHTVQHAPHTTAKFSHLIRLRPPFCYLHITTWRGCGEDHVGYFDPKHPKYHG